MAYRRRVTGGSVFQPHHTKIWWVRWCHKRRTFQISTGTADRHKANGWLANSYVARVVDKILAPVHRGRWGKKSNDS